MTGGLLFTTVVFKLREDLEGIGGDFAIFEDIFDCQDLEGGVLLAFSGQRPGMLLKCQDRLPQESIIQPKT